ncbi:anti-sigma factor [Ruania alkalisoli]|uniref:Regulator of SigK n=1 Tax=Ruania alkalisoli TaxID=2779775 RepID=A0A7M1SZ17_9MICO|nr:anti-sigma factor [Ruania alkalisoli]QOR72830.1 anti-sigma factor [Ruania alkalisoli]
MTDDASIHALTGAYVLDALDETERAAFEEHLADCAVCRDEVASLRGATERLAHISAVDPPPELREQILAGIERIRPLPPIAAEVAQPPEADPDIPRISESSPEGTDELAFRRRRRDRNGAARAWRLVAAVACLVAVVAVGWGVGARPDQEFPRQVAPIETSSDDARLLQILHASDLEVVTAGGAEGPEAALFVSRENGAAAVTFRGLPAIGQDQDFQAWTLVDGVPTSAGVMAAADGAATMIMDAAALSTDAMAVSVEPAGGSDQPTGEIVAQMPMP